MKTAEDVADQLRRNLPQYPASPVTKIEHANWIDETNSVIAKALTAYAEERVKEVELGCDKDCKGCKSARAEALEEAVKVAESCRNDKDQGYPSEIAEKIRALTPGE